MSLSVISLPSLKYIEYLVHYLKSFFGQIIKITFPIFLHYLGAGGPLQKLKTEITQLVGGSVIYNSLSAFLNPSRSTFPVPVTRLQNNTREEDDKLLQCSLHTYIILNQSVHVFIMVFNRTIAMIDPAQIWYTQKQPICKNVHMFNKY